MSKSLAIAYAMKKKSKKMADGGAVGGAKTSTTGNKTKTGGSNPGGASTGGAGTVTITTGKIPPKGINISNVGGKTAARNAGGMDPADQDDDMMMAKGGLMHGSGQDRSLYADGDEVKASPTPDSNDTFHIGQQFPKDQFGGNRPLPPQKAQKKAHGGQIEDNYQSAGNPHVDKEWPYESSEKASGYAMHEGNTQRPNGRAVSEDSRRLNQHGQIEQGEQGGGQGFHSESYMGNQGDAHDEYQSVSHMMDMVDRIMAQRQQSFSQGGKVANDTGTGQEADKLPNQYDDLVLRDDLESTYGDDDNSGDNLGNAQEDEDRKDIVARIMASRKKKDRMPNPA